MQLEAQLVHAEPGKRVVQVRALANDQCLGSALGEAPTAEEAEDRASARLLARLATQPEPLSQPQTRAEPLSQPQTRAQPPSDPKPKPQIQAPSPKPEQAPCLNQQLQPLQDPTTPNPNCPRFKSWNRPQRSRAGSPRTGVANWQAWTCNCNGWVGPVMRKRSI